VGRRAAPRPAGRPRIASRDSGACAPAP
jgi:hypothetical protein